MADRSADGASAVTCHTRRGGDAMIADVHAAVVGIVERASSLRERMVDEPRQRVVAGPGRVAAFMDAWCSAAAKGDDSTFDRRLALDGLDRSTAERAMTAVRVPPGNALPEWATLLERYLNVLGRSQATAREHEREIPFAELFAPLADLVEREVSCALPRSRYTWSHEARSGLRATLLQRLADRAAPVLYERFDRRRAEHLTPPPPSAGEMLDSSQPPGIYARFLEEMLHGGMLDLFTELPSLARVMGVTALHWRDASTELLSRLDADRAAIASSFANGRDPGELMAIEAGLSDPHAGGRTVHVLTFAGGLRLVYKPRGLGVDTAFNELLGWLALRGAPLPPPLTPTLAARVLDRGSHGWAEYVEQCPCVDDSAVRRYYQNAGSLLALLYALGSTDCHYENIVADGDRPVIVDLETVLQPEIARAEPPLDRARNIGARRLYDDSVLRTGLLPIWQSSSDGGAFDIGGFSASAGQTTPFTAVRWIASNTDSMHIERRHALTAARPNLPVLAGRTTAPAHYLGDIELGFTRMYEWLASHRDALLAPDGPVERLAREKVRFIARPSSVYDHVLRRSLRSAALRDGAARGVELEILARALLPLSRGLWPLLGEEQEALEQLDIPLFTLRGDATQLVLGEHAIELARSGVEVARSRFASLCESDLARQLRIIRASFALRNEGEGTPLPASGGAALPDAERGGSGILSRTELLAAALEIADQIHRLALEDCRGEITWITVEPVSRSGHHRLQATGYGLYDGLAGIALFLAAAARCSSGGPELAELARRALRPLRERLRASSPSYVEEYGIGGACGMASAIYALTRTGWLLDDDCIVDDALLAARQITPAAIARDSNFDVLHGSAGAILALLALHRVRPADQLLDLSRECARHLLARRELVRTPRGTEHRAWRTSDGRASTGFAHGAAGIACALLRLHAATGCTELLDAALDALRYEDSLLYPAPSDGSPCRTTVGAARSERVMRSVTSAWCRGSAGMGLARLARTNGSRAGELRVGLQRSLAHVLSDGAGGAPLLDSACCGEMGAIELLLSVGLERGGFALLATAQERASRMVRRAHTNGRYLLSASLGGQISDPALYRGLAGIGYGLLRLCNPETLPSLLAWE